jgi:chemotaxis signal transduction protein
MSDQKTEVTQYLTFVVSGEEFGIEIRHVREIVAHGALTRLPGAPEPVRGVTNLRGAVVPVIDLGIKFRLGQSVPASTTCFIILELDIAGGRKLIGLVADEVLQVLDVRVSDIEAPPTFGTPVSPEALVGLVRSGARFTLLLEIDRVLATLDIEMADPNGADDATQSWSQRPGEEAEPTHLDRS